MSRALNKWTPAEDSLLLRQVARAAKAGKAKDWTSIAEALPGRSNKDCRKRWCNHLVGGLRKGPWEQDEDERLAIGVREHGQQWPLVAEEVGVRSADQCAKRWHQSLDPALDHSKWSEEEERTLLKAVEKHGRSWKSIAKRYFPDRATNNVKNRYVTLTRRRDPHLGRDSDGKCSTEDVSSDSASPPGGDASMISPTDVSAWSTDVLSTFDSTKDGTPDPFSFDLLINADAMATPAPPPTIASASDQRNDTFSADFLMDDASLFDLDLNMGTNSHAASVAPSASRHVSESPSVINTRIGQQVPGALPGNVQLDHPDLSPQMAFPGLSESGASTPEFVLTIANPAPETVTVIMGTLVNSGTRFRIDMR